jgi:zinc transporter
LRAAWRSAAANWERCGAPWYGCSGCWRRSPPHWVGGEDLQDLRQSGEEFSTAVADSAALAERVRLLQEELVVLTNEQTNRTLFVLTFVTVLALPINLVAGLFGMNVGGIPLGGYQHGFTVIVAILALTTLLLAYLAFGCRRD